MARSVDEVVRELAAIAFADVRNMFDRRGRPRRPGEIPPALRSAIKTFHVRRVRMRLARRGERATRTVEVVRVELSSKLAALDALARHAGMYGIRPAVETVPAPSLTEPTADILDRFALRSRPARRPGRRAA
jgi:hypothetical protein